MTAVCCAWRKEETDIGALDGGADGDELGHDGEGGGENAGLSRDFPDFGGEGVPSTI